MKQKIVLEVVPWVDKKASAGWNNEKKSELIALCKTSGLAKLMLNPNDLCVCILNQFSSKYTFDEYHKLLAAEKSKAFRDFGNNCIGPKTADASLLETFRNDVRLLKKSGEFARAIDLINSGILVSGRATAFDYNELASLYLLSRQFEQAISAIEKAGALDNFNLLIKLNQAHYELLSGNYQSAKGLHKKYRPQNVSAGKSWSDRTREDFSSFEKAGISSKDFDRILKFLETSN